MRSPVTFTSWMRSQPSGKSSSLQNWIFNFAWLLSSYGPNIKGFKLPTRPQNGSLQWEYFLFFFLILLLPESGPLGPSRLLPTLLSVCVCPSVHWICASWQTSGAMMWRFGRLTGMTVQSHDTVVLWHGDWLSDSQVWLVKALTGICPRSESNQYFPVLFERSSEGPKRNPLFYCLHNFVGGSCRYIFPCRQS